MNANAHVLLEVSAILAAHAPKAARDGTHANDVLTRFDVVDDELVAKGFPATSPWWRHHIHRWYESGCRQFVPRCGRRAGKSSTLSRLGVVEALYGHHDVPPGDIGVVAIVSTRKDEAAARLATIKSILDALGVAYTAWGDGVQGIKLVGRRVGFRVFAASVQGVSGFTSIFVICDEVAKWKDADTGQNPATEVLASVRPTMATQPNARIVLSSSPFSILDAHYDAFEAGDSDFQIVASAPTWEANPTLTEADTRALEPDESKWLREYKAVPQAEVESSLLEEAELLEVTRKKNAGDLPPMPGWTYVATMDPATRTNAWTLTIIGQGPRGVRHLCVARHWVPKKGKPLRSADVLREIKALITPYALRSVHTDQAGTDHMREIIRLLPAAERFALVEEPWTPASKAQAYEFLRKLVQQRRLGLPDDKWVRSDLLGIVKKITRSGVTYQLIERNGRHSDYAPALAMGVADARFPAKHPTKPLTDQQQERAAKAKYLSDREKAKKREQRFGRLPPTHRMRKPIAA